MFECTKWERIEQSKRLEVFSLVQRIKVEWKHKMKIISITWDIKHMQTHTHTQTRAQIAHEN